MTFEAIFFWVCLFIPLLNLLWIAPCCSSFESQPTERVHTRELLRIHLRNCLKSLGSTYCVAFQSFKELFFRPI